MYKLRGAAAGRILRKFRGILDRHTAKFLLPPSARRAYGRRILVRGVIVEKEFRRKKFARAIDPNIDRYIRYVLIKQRGVSK